LKPVVCRRVVGRLPPPPRKKRWIYLVRSLGFQPETSSHDWHVQPSCQRPIRISAWAARFQSRRSSLVYSTKARPTVLETCVRETRLNYAFATMTVNPLCSQDFHLFPTTRSHYMRFSCTRQNASPDRLLCKNQCQFGTSRRGRHSLDKRSLWRFLRKTQNPFEALCPRIEPRGRGWITRKICIWWLDAGRSREFQNLSG